MPRLSIILGLLLAFSSRAVSQDDKVTLEPKEKWTNLAADSKIKTNFTIKSPVAFKGNVKWTFKDIGTKRNFPKGFGEKAIGVDANKPTTVEVPLVVPPIKPGVVWQGQLIVMVFADGKKEPEATYDKTYWIFPDDPFVDKLKWFEDLKITLFDSDPKSKTAEVLTKLASLKDVKKPFEQTSNVNGLAEVKEGLILVGEGVSFKDENAGLAEELLKAAARGVPVLVLAPKEGNFLLPGADNMLPAPGSMNFQRQDIITKLDKRFDALAWAPDNQVVVRSLGIKTDDGKVVAEVQDGAKGWPWLQLDYPDKKSRLVFCGFPIVQRWDDNRTPRFLLSRLFEHVTELSVTDSTK